MRLPGVAMVGADTARSRAYAQRLAGEGALLDAALMVRSPNRWRWGQISGALEGLEGGFFDLSLPLETSLSALTRDLSVIDTGTLNCQEVEEWLARASPDLLIFSGFGGEIIEERVLDHGVPILHVHSGWLPDYRGSTTIYYSALREGDCGATAILLDSDIDTGPIVARKRYPLPPPGVDIDYVYDSSIRADLLIEVLHDWVANGGRFNNLIPQPVGGLTHYIIHPVLKHLAIERISQRVAAS